MMRVAGAAAPGTRRTTQAGALPWFGKSRPPSVHARQASLANSHRHALSPINRVAQVRRVETPQVVLVRMEFIMRYDNAFLPQLDPIPVPIWLTMHRELHTSRRIRLVFDLLAEALA